MCRKKIPVIAASNLPLRYSYLYKINDDMFMAYLHDSEQLVAVEWMK